MATIAAPGCVFRFLRLHASDDKYATPFFQFLMEQGKHKALGVKCLQLGEEGGDQRTFEAMVNAHGEFKRASERGSAKVAATLFEETPQSIEAREAERARRGMERLGLQVPSSRPSKNARRALRKLKQEGEGD